MVTCEEIMEIKWESKIFTNFTQRIFNKVWSNIILFPTNKIILSEAVKYFNFHIEFNEMNKIWKVVYKEIFIDDSDKYIAIGKCLKQMGETPYETIIGWKV